MQTLTELKQQAQQERDQVVSIANAADEEVLLAVKKAVDQSLCSFLLFGIKEEIQKTARTVELDLMKEQITIIHVDSNPSGAAVKAVHDRKADILMKGNVSTKELLKAVLNKESGLRTGGVLSHVALFEIPNQDRLVFLTDAAMNLTPTLQEKEQIINNVVQVAQGVNIFNPKVAVLAAVEVVNPAMQATIDAALLTQMQKRNQIKGCTIDGPLAFDNAVSRKAANHKNIHSEVAGNADILMVPTIEVGNSLYKSFMYFADAKVAAVISGAKAPIVLTSRTDSSDSKLYSLSLALVSSKTF
ncbi:phosphate butyryltransferase [Virgibacillus subterraneus]|uniref:Phosphate butyryltransferase n=1 Tax=Virgibacillus subterraneus TaxID=621109 RepID=A0A1H9E6R7_9BACI|nr:phosphate butyryltransferase [Virgibacillus subterraneus]SEQ20933.1 phosphate butyryltransferase [Virgibacillus subterraneus]